MEIIFTGGLGDIIALECMIDPRKVGTIHWFTRAASITVPLFEQSPTWRKTKHKVYDVGKTYFERAGIDRDFPGLPTRRVADWSISQKFRDHPGAHWRPSTFLTDPPVPIDHLDLPTDYVAIQGATTLHADAQQRALRNLDAREWDALTRRLEGGSTVGVVLNAADAPRPPKHPRLVDLTGRTSVGESLAVLRQAHAYWGIASSLCVAASQLFGVDQLWVKGPEAWLKNNLPVYFAPHARFPFVKDHLCEPQAPMIYNRMLIRFLVSRIHNNTLVGPGSVVDCPREQADAYLATGQGVPYEPTVLKRAVAVPPRRKAVSHQ